MTTQQDNAEFERRLAALERDRSLDRNTINQLERRLDELEQTIAKIVALKTPMPFFPAITPQMAERVVKLRADLFHNPDAKQGSCKYVLKVFVWLDKPSGMRGHILPYEFWLNQVPEGGEDIRQGKLTHKAKKTRPGIKGTQVVPDHVAMCHVSNWHQFSQCMALVQVRDQVWALDQYEAIPEPKANEPVARWYWQADEARA